MKYYIKTKSDIYLNVEDYTYLVEAASKADARPVSKAIAESFTAGDPDLEIEEVK